VTRETWNAGAEYDHAVAARLRAVLVALGYEAREERWLLGGSQEITRVELSGPRGRIEVEAETYVGITVSGDADAIAEIRSAMIKGPASVTMPTQTDEPKP
jgi:hypothetical protein